MKHLFILLGSLNLMLVVILGAFGAHALGNRLSESMMSVYQTGIQYHFYHAVGLILVGIIAFHISAPTLLKWSGGLMLLGIVLFSGSLYLLTLTETRWLGMITPFGGLAFILSWLLLAIAAYRTL
ncbi:MAG: DUF423 domain-containing protein [Gammaproteobacteria bacterium]